MKKYLQPDEKITFCRVDKKGSGVHDVTKKKFLTHLIISKDRTACIGKTVLNEGLGT